MVFINKPYTHAYVPLPSASTVLTSLLAASNITLDSAVTGLILQAQGAGARIELDGSNATATSFLIPQNETLSLRCQPGGNWFGDIRIMRDAAGANLSLNGFST